MPNPSLATVGPQRVPLSCVVCRGQLFTSQEVKLNTTGMEFLNLGWANRSATAVICANCGFVHTFDGQVELWQPDRGYPG